MLRVYLKDLSWKESFLSYCMINQGFEDGLKDGMFLVTILSDCDLNLDVLNVEYAGSILQVSEIFNINQNFIYFHKN